MQRREKSELKSFIHCRFTCCYNTLTCTEEGQKGQKPVCLPGSSELLRTYSEFDKSLVSIKKMGNFTTQTYLIKYMQIRSHAVGLEMQFNWQNIYLPRMQKALGSIYINYHEQKPFLGPVQPGWICLTTITVLRSYANKNQSELVNYMKFQERQLKLQGKVTAQCWAMDNHHRTLTQKDYKTCHGMNYHLERGSAHTAKRKMCDQALKIGQN